MRLPARRTLPSRTQPTPRSWQIVRDVLVVATEEGKCRCPCRHLLTLTPPRGRALDDLFGQTVAEILVSCPRSDLANGNTAIEGPWLAQGQSASTVPSRAALSSTARAKRSVGFLRRQRIMMAPSPPGYVVQGLGVRRAESHSRHAVVSAGKARLPDSISLYSRAERKDIERASAGFALGLLRRHISGRNRPRSGRTRVWVISSLTPCLARPKSTSFTSPSWLTRMLPGFRSRWTIPFRCAASNASAICNGVAQRLLHRQWSPQRLTLHVFHHQIIRPDIIHAQICG